MTNTAHSLIENILTRCKQVFAAQKLSLTSRKLYLADIKKFLIFSSERRVLTGSSLADPWLYKSYLKYMEKTASPASMTRSQAALKQLGKVVAAAYGNANPMEQLTSSSIQSKNSGNISAYDKYIKYFTNYLNASHLSALTIRSYKSDIAQYLSWASTQGIGRDMQRLLTEKNTEKYLDNLSKSVNVAASTWERKKSSIARFTEWYHNSYPALTVADKNSVTEVVEVSTAPGITAPLVAAPRVQSVTSRQHKDPVLFSHIYTRILPFTVLLVLMAGLVYFGYRQFARDRVLLTQAYPSTPVTPNRQLSFQGRLEDSSGTPITSATNVVFKLWDDPDVGDGNQLYSSGTCSITPDTDGIFSTQIGGTCGSGISSSVFTENSNVYLEVTVAAEVLSPRQQIATVAYALNSETLQGFPISSTVSAIKNTVVPMNQWGEILVGEQSPRLTGVAGTFQISAPSLSLVTATGTNGNITFSPDGTGQVNVNGNTTTTSFFNVSNAQLTTGSLITGTAANNNSGFKLLDLLSGSSPTSKFSVTAVGNTTMAGDLTVSGDDLFMNTNTAGYLLIADGTNYNPTAVSGDLTINGSGVTAIGADKITEAMLKSVNGPTDEYCLSYESSVGDFEWQSCAAGTATSNWRITNGAISPINDTLDLLVGSTATSSAKFAVLNVSSGVPVASVSAGVSGAAYLTADGNLATTANQSLTIGGSTTGNILLHPAGTGNVGIGTADATSRLIVDAEATTGSELVTNGTFTGSATGWTLGDCATYSSNQVSVSKSGCTDESVSTTIAVTSGKTYRMDFTLTGVFKDKVYVDFANITVNSVETFTEGQHSYFFTSDYTGSETVFVDGWNYTENGEWNIDDVSIKEITPVIPVLTAIGFDGNSALSLGDNLGQNTSLGISSLANNTTGFFNTALGANALYSNTDGFANIGIGSKALYSNTTGDANIGIGSESLQSNSSGTGNVAIGNLALTTSTIGNANTAVGNQALEYSEIAGNNTAIGYYALRTTTLGSGNTSLGAYSMNSNTLGTSNTAIGMNAGALLTEGNQNTLLGMTSGSNITTGDSNIIIGYAVDALTATSNNTLNIGNMIYGTDVSGIGTAVSPGNIGIGTQSPDAKLDSLATSGQQLRLTYTDGSVYSGFTLDSSGNLTIDNTGTRTIIADDLQISGDDLFMNTNTAGYLLIADGTNYNPTAVSGDLTINGSGVTAIGADKITEAMLKSVNGPTDEYCLSYESSVGDFEWQTCGSGGSGSNWRITSGAISPVNDTLDLLVGSTATASAKFAVINVGTGTPTATISAGVNGSTFLTANGILSTTNRQSLVLGNSSASDVNGHILLQPTGSHNVGIGTTNPTTKLYVAGDITGNQFLDSANSAYFLDPASTSTSMNVAGDIYVGSGVSTFGTAVSDDTIEATQFCVGDGETNCITDFSAATIWTDAGSYIYPTDGEVLGNAASGGSNKIAGLYLADSSPVVFGTDNDFTFSFNNSTSTLGSTLTAGTRFGINTTSALATLDVRSSLGTIPVASISGNTSMAALVVDQSGSGDIFTASSSGMTQFVVKKNGNVGIGVSDPTSRLQIGGSTSTISNSSGDITIDSAGGSVVLGTDDDLIPTLGAGSATLGSDTLRWDDLYLSASSLHIGTSITDEGVISYDTSSNIFNFGTDSTTNADIAFFTDDLYLDKSSGFVGIGLTSPSSVLDVADTLTITGLAPALRLNETDNAIWQYLVTGDQWIVQRSGTDRMVVTNTGTMIVKGDMYNNEDTTVNIGASAASSTLQLVSNNTANAVLTDLGKFGIGNTNPVGKLDVNGAVTGKALAIFNETGGQDILTASASGTTRFRVATDGFVYGARYVDSANSSYYIDPASTGTSLSIDGNIVSNGAFSISTGSDAIAVSIGTTGAGKLDAGTIDPPYTINGEKFATYMTSMTGVKEETTGVVETSEYTGTGYRTVIDFAKEEKGSDLWLFAKVSDLKANMRKMVVLLSPMGNTKAWYNIYPEHGILEIYTSTPAQVSYRLTAPRFDHEQWQNTRNSDSIGFTIDSTDGWNSGDSPLALSPSFDITADRAASADGEKYSLIDQAGNVVREFISASQGVIANLRAGSIETDELKTDLISPLTAGAEIHIDSPVVIQENRESSQPELVVQGEIEATTVSARLAQLDEIKTNKLYADEIVAGKIVAGDIEGLDARIASLSAGTAVELTDDEVDSITERIKSRIASLTGNAPQAQDLPAPAEASLSASFIAESIDFPDIASDSAVLTSLDADFVTINDYLAVIGQATISALDVTGSLYSDSLSSKSDVLALQPLGGTVKLAAGTLIVDSSGDVAVNGNLTVSGSILAQSAEFNSLSLGTPTASGSAGSALGQLLAVYDEQGQAVATIDASGSATLAGVTTKLITIAAGKESTPSGLLSATATSNSTAGESILVSPNTELTVESPYVTANSLVYLTPTTNTDNKVLFVKSKESCEASQTSCTRSFTVGIDAPAQSDISFNWWIIEIDKKNE